MGDGDGWVYCQQGHRHWGRLGAAGLLLMDRGRVLLQHRAERTHEGNTWGVPGGARDSHEDPVQSALREAHEEADILAANVDPIGTVGVDHGGWSYTTVLASVQGEIRPRAANWESTEVHWWPVADVASLALHPGFGAAWPALHHQPRPLTIVVDMANVLGSRPDGWWRDRRGATARLAAQVTGLARTGIAVAALPPGIDLGSIERVFPRLILVVEGAARALGEPGGPQPDDAAGASDPSAWWQPRTTIVAAAGSGDDQISCEARRVVGPLVVVTADRGLRTRLSAITRGSDTAVRSTGPRWLYGLLP